jgi:hypothetical protein
MDYGAFQLTESNETQNAENNQYGSQTAGAKLRCREENSPDRLLRSPNPS